MKKIKLMYIVIVTHVLFIFLHVYKHAKIVTAHYHLEQHNTTYKTLKKEKLSLQEEWYTIQNPEYLQNYARKYLAMKKIRLNQIKKIPDIDNLDIDNNVKT